MPSSLLKIQFYFLFKFFEHYGGTGTAAAEMEKNERERRSFAFSSVHESGSYFLSLEMIVSDLGSDWVIVAHDKKVYNPGF